MKKEIEYGKFKKIAQDGKSVTLKHPGGHDLRIAISGVDKELKKRLLAMPLHQSDTKDEIKVPEPEPAPIPDDTPTPTATIEPPQAAPSDTPIAPTVDQQQPDTTSGVPTAPVAQDAAAATDDSDSGEETESDKVAAQTAPQPAPDTSQSAAPQAPAAPAAQQPASDGSTFHDDPLDLKNNLLKEDQFFQNDLYSGHINPKSIQDLYNEKNTGGKIGTIFGLLFGGIGSGLTHQPNALLEQMNKEIANDLQGQINSKQNAQNLYRMNLEHQRNIIESKKANAGIQLTQAQSKYYDKMAAATAANTTYLQMGRTEFASRLKDWQAMPEGPKKQQMGTALGMMAQSLDSNAISVGNRLQATGAMLQAGEVQQGNIPEPEDQFQARQQQGSLLPDNNPQKQKLNWQATHHIPNIPGYSTREVTPADTDFVRDNNNLRTNMSSLKTLIDSNVPNTLLTNTQQGLNAREQVKALLGDIYTNYSAAHLGGHMSDQSNSMIAGIFKNFDKLGPQELHNLMLDPRLDALYKQTTEKRDNYLGSMGFPGYPKGATPYPSNTQNSAPPQAPAAPALVSRKTADGRTALYDPKNKSFVRWQDQSNTAGK